MKKDTTWNNNKEFCRHAVSLENNDCSIIYCSGRRCNIDGNYCQVNEKMRQSKADSICDIHEIDSNIKYTVSRIITLKQRIEILTKTKEGLEKSLAEKEQTLKDLEQERKEMQND